MGDIAICSFSALWYVRTLYFTCSVYRLATAISVSTFVAVLLWESNYELLIWATKNHLTLMNTVPIPFLWTAFFPLSFRFSTLLASKERLQNDILYANFTHSQCTESHPFSLWFDCFFTSANLLISRIMLMFSWNELLSNKKMYKNNFICEIFERMCD